MVEGEVVVLRGWSEVGRGLGRRFRIFLFLVVVIG